VPKKSKPAKRRAFYKSPPPQGWSSGFSLPKSGKQKSDKLKFELQPSAHFTLREDGSIGAPASGTARSKQIPNAVLEAGAPPSTLVSRPSTLPELVYHDDAHKVWLYHGNSLDLLDAIAAKYPEGRFDAIFADPPYFLSNGGITCHAGKMIKVDKGDWDVSRGPELNHEFNTEWLRRCQRVLKPNGTIWVTGTHHVIFSIGC
jgi:hypothetical protein